MADDPIGPLTKSPMFWHLDEYATPAAADADKGPRSTIVESLGRVWLMTIEDEKWRPVHGNRVSEVGPLTILVGEKYSTQYMEAIFTPGMTAPAHIHSGPEAWYTLAGGNLPGDFRWSHTSRPCRRAAGDRSRGFVDASHRDRDRTAPFLGAHPS
jgi:hypothetical protein